MNPTRGLAVNRAIITVATAIIALAGCSDADQTSSAKAADFEMMPGNQHDI